MTNKKYGKMDKDSFRIEFNDIIIRFMNTSNAFRNENIPLMNIEEATNTLYDLYLKDLFNKNHFVSEDEEEYHNNEDEEDNDYKTIRVAIYLNVPKNFSNEEISDYISKTAIESIDENTNQFSIVDYTINEI